MKIRITNGRGWYRHEVGEVFEVTGRCEFDGYYVKVWNDNKNRWVTDENFVSDGHYEIVEESAPNNNDDIIANLVRRVHSLEQQLRDTQNNVERQSVEIAEVKHLAESNEEDIRTLDERTQYDNIAYEIAGRLNR